MRCRHTGSNGQCTHQSVDGSVFCAKHSSEADRIRGYRINDPKLRERMGHHNDEASLQTIEQEIILMRAMIEDRITMAESKSEREAAFTIVTTQLVNVNKLVESLNKLRRTSSTILGKAALLRLNTQIASILIDELNDVEDRDTIIDKIASKIAGAIAAIKNEDE